MKRVFRHLCVAVLIAAPDYAGAQSTGGSPNDPNNARNQFPCAVGKPVPPIPPPSMILSRASRPHRRCASTQAISREDKQAIVPGYLPPAPVVGPPEVVERPGVPAAPDPVVDPDFVVGPADDSAEGILTSLAAVDQQAAEEQWLKRWVATLKASPLKARATNCVPAEQAGNGSVEQPQPQHWEI